MSKNQAGWGDLYRSYLELAPAPEALTLFVDREGQGVENRLTHLEEGDTELISSDGIVFPVKSKLLRASGLQSLLEDKLERAQQVNRIYLDRPFIEHSRSLEILLDFIHGKPLQVLTYDYLLSMFDVLQLTKIYKCESLLRFLILPLHSEDNNIILPPVLFRLAAKMDDQLLAVRALSKSTMWNYPVPDWARRKREGGDLRMQWHQQLAVPYETWVVKYAPAEVYWGIPLDYLWALLRATASARSGIWETREGRYPTDWDSVSERFLGFMRIAKGASLQARADMQREVDRSWAGCSGNIRMTG